MRKLLMMLGILVAGSSLTMAGDWFDMENCGICKCMADKQELMQHVKWATYELPNGMMSVAVIPGEHKETMMKAHDEMMAAVKRLESGEAMELCGYCESYGELMGMGAEKHELDTIGGMITMITSDDEEVVKKIHEHARKSTAEYKKMLQMQASS